MQNFKYLFLAVILMAGSTSLYSQDETLSIVSYNLLNFPDGRNDCSGNIVVENRADTLKKIVDFLQPDILGVCEIQNVSGVNQILNQSFNIHPENNYLAAPFIQTSDLNNALFYNADKLTFKEHLVVNSNPRKIDHYILYVNDPTLDVYYDTTFIEVFMVHFKAGQSANDKSVRAVQTESLMQYIATRPSDRNIFVGGDMNVYTSNELAYQHLISGSASLKDPINSPGNWHSNSSFSAIHTQSTRRNEYYDCGSTGGLDDRFDQILVSNSVMTGTESVQFQEGSYRSVGNDGQHYDVSLITGANSMYPEDLVRALYFMSDHLPVELKVDIFFPTSNGLALVPSVSGTTCYGGEDGTATITANQGQAPYQYQWDAAAGYQTTATAVGLGAGTYCVTVTDALGEEDDYCVTIGEPTQIEYSAFVTNDVNGNCEGQINLLVTGGEEPYTYSWTELSEEESSQVFDLCEGTYHVTVTDDLGCELAIEIEITGYLSLTEEQGMHAINVYPNPATEKIDIAVNSSGLNGGISFTLLDLNGKIIKKEEVKKDAEEIVKTMSLSEVQKGIYILQIQSENFNEAIKVVVL